MAIACWDNATTASACAASNAYVVDWGRANARVELFDGACLRVLDGSTDQGKLKLNMRTINAKELSASLPDIVRREKKGERLTVLYRSRPAFQIVPPSEEALV